MKQKYKIQILLICVLMSGIWGTLGTWLVMKNPDNQVMIAIICYVVYMICMIIPIKMIVNRARKDLKPL